MSRDWYDRLNRANNMVTHFKSVGGKAVVLHLDNPLRDADCGRLSMFVFETRVAIPVAAPLEWTWFFLVGTDSGKVYARFSIDGRSSSLITWDPLGSWRSVIADPGSDGYHYNHRDDCSAYAFLSMVGCDAYKILSLTKSNLASPGYDVQMYLSTTGRWSSAVRTPPMIDRLSSGYAVVSSWVFGSIVKSALRFGVHVMTINLSHVGAMAWGRHLFIGVANMTETPSLKIGRDLLGISHCVCGFDGAAASLDEVVSVAQFCSIGLKRRSCEVYWKHYMAWSCLHQGVHGVFYISLTIADYHVVLLRDVFSSLIQPGFGGYDNGWFGQVPCVAVTFPLFATYRNLVTARLFRWAAVFNPPFQSKCIMILLGITGLFSSHGPNPLHL
ncbi:hypothetical protein AHAS_Ahas11G0098100 [Arachis hypogaea]